ncbi:MAG: UvrD-helicase domain-containing protein [Arcobacteraceae bacterium]|jgi:DNA helicase-2/ATP-dependent DNA helicase PcrA
MKLTEEQNTILNTTGNLLVIGGPGSGKTTISIFKAAKLLEGFVCQEKKVLFLSFARATISRVVEAIENEHDIENKSKKRIEVETYHSFFWQILKTYGYLIGLPRKISILTPSNEAIALSTIRKEYGANSKLTAKEFKEKKYREKSELKRLAKDEGLICFDLFAYFVTEILLGSNRIRTIIATKYPVIILDEFQDTSTDQWNLIKTLYNYCEVIALADPEQRIYDWIGADPERLKHFEETFCPKIFDLSSANHRSKGTDIALFGNDVLSGNFNQEKYLGIYRKTFRGNKNQAWTSLITNVLEIRKTLIKAGNPSWSLAILVPTKKMTRLVSENLHSPPAKLPIINHSAVIDIEAIVLSAELIAYLLQPLNEEFYFEKFIELLINYFLGKGGSSPTKTSIAEAERIQKAFHSYHKRKAEGKSISKGSILVKTLETYSEICNLQFTGNPDKDWQVLRNKLENSECKRLKDVAYEARNLRLLKRGDTLRQILSDDWRTTGAYTNALKLIRESFVKEHFATTKKPETGVVVMNMHKAKGKQFDAVIIFEGWPNYAQGKIVSNADRIVRNNNPEYDNIQSRQNLRVSITRGKSMVTILTPQNDPCILLFEREDET